MGVTESPAGSNRTKYGKWMGLDGQPWCMSFVQWCFHQAGTPLPHKTGSCSALLNWYQKNRPECVVKDPQPGDIAIFTFGHTGIVEPRPFFHILPDSTGDCKDYFPSAARFARITA